MKKGGILALIVVGLLATIGVFQYIGYHNTWTEKKNLYENQVEDNKVIYDEVWKVLKQQAGVTDKYANDFRENYVAIMEGRNYGGEAFKWVQEANPAFDQSMYKTLMNSIEVQRSKFTVNQRNLTSIHRELKNLKEKFPSNLFLGSKELPELVTVTSTKTEQTFETGKEDDVELF